MPGTTSTPPRSRNLGRQAVMVASQAISGNEQKKDHAVRALLSDALKVGVKIGTAKAGEVVEAQINQLKRERGVLG